VIGEEADKQASRAAAPCGRGCASDGAAQAIITNAAAIRTRPATPLSHVAVALPANHVSHCDHTPAGCSLRCGAGTTCGCWPRSGRLSTSRIGIPDHSPAKASAAGMYIQNQFISFPQGQLGAAFLQAQRASTALIDD
jgi:hypothetical protein